MKIKFLILSIIILFSCAGCSSVSKLNNQDYSIFDDYINTIGEKCMIYIENDQTLSAREKNVYKTRHRIIKEQLETLKEK